MATSIQNPSNTNITVNEWTNVYSAGPVAGFTGTVRIVVEVGNGTTIKLANNATGVTAITQGYGNLYNGSTTSMAFEGNLAQVNAALQSLQAFSTNAAGSGTLQISAVKAGSAYNPDNGHYYQAIYSSGGIGWQDAKTAAASASIKFNGLQGYLATITSAKENEFILNKLPADAWIGATDKDTEGRWNWDTGPEAGVTVSDLYHNWNSGEPNNSSSHPGSPEGEDYAQFYVSGGSPGKWNDLPGGGATAGKLNYYVVEYGGMQGDAPTEAAASSSSTLTVQARPVITSNGGGATAIVNYAENGTAAVTTVTATDADSGDTKTYSISGGADSALFGIDANTGALTFKTSPDYEGAGDNSYEVTVCVTDSTGLYDEQTLTVNVTDVNDHAPVFTSDGTATVAENAVTSTVIYDAATTDADGTGANKNVVYSLKTGQGDDADLLNINSATGEVTLKTSANYEVKNSYAFTVVATNAGTGATLDTEHAVTVSVTDENEAATALGLSATSIAENVETTGGIKIGDISITDPDASGNNNSLSVAGDDAASFEIRNGTELFFKDASPDFETQTSYSITLTATDGSLVYSQAFTVNVTDINDNAPVFTSGNTGTVAENAATTTVIYAAATTDADGTAPNQAVTYSLKGDGSTDDAELLNINGTTGEVTLKTSANYEVKDSYAFTVVATNVGTGATLATEQAVTVSVTDVAEAVTDLALSATGIDENVDTTSGVKIGDISITDPDASGNNNTLTLEGADNAPFEIRNGSELFFKGASPDFETKPSYSITLKATDGGLVYSQAFTVNVTDVNEVPVITSNGGDTPTPISYAENGTTAVTSITATDPDSGDTQTFSISGGDDADLFRINASTGALTFRNSPNFEIPADANNDNTYNVTVKVADAAGLTDEQTLTINVTDDAGADDPIETGSAGSQTITAPADNAKINVTGSGTTTITNPVGNLTIANSGSGTVVVQGLNDGATVNTSGTGATQISDPEGSLTVANSGTGTVTVDGLNTDSVLTTTGSGPTAVTNPDGNLSVANNGTGTVTVSGLNADASLTASGTGPTQVSDPEGSLSINNNSSGTVTVDGLNTGSVLTTTGSGPTAVTNPDGNLEVANSGTGTVTVSGLNPGASLTASGTGPTQVNDPEGHLTVNNNSSGTVTVNGLNTDSVLTTTGSGPTTVANPDGNLSVANNGTGTVTVNGLNPNASLSASGSGPTLIENPDASLIVANSGTGTVTVNGLNTGGVLTTTGSGPTAVTNPDGSLAVANNGTGTVTVNGLNPNASLTANGTGPTLVKDPEGNLTVSNSGSGTVTVAGLNDDAVLNSNGTGPVRVTYPDDDVSVVNNGSGTVSVDGMKAGAVLSSSGTGPVTITNPDGNLRVANTGTGAVTVEDLKPGAILTATGTKPVNVDLSHLSSGQTITIDNDGSGVVNLVNVPEGVTVLTTGSSGSGDINYAPTLSGVPGTTQGVTAGSAAVLADFTVADQDSSQTLTVTLTTTNGSIVGLTDADTAAAGIQLTGTAAAINTALETATFTAASAGAASIGISVTDGVVTRPTTATYNLIATSAPSSGGAPAPAPTPTPTPAGAIQDGVSDTNVTENGTEQTTTVGTIGTVPVVETVTVTADGDTVRELVYVPTTTGTGAGAGSSTPTVLPLLYETVAGSTSNTTVSLPTGVGLVSVGDRTPTTTGQEGLITLIQSTVSDGDPSRTDMLGGGQSFLNTLPQDATLWVNKIQLTAPTALPNAPSVPVVVSGAARTEASTSTADKLEALVIDATALPQGTVIELHDIDFAVVVGNGVFVRGGSGANVVYGGAGSQYILLGEADDVLYGGADDDTVGSEGGNDRIFGNAGNDTLFGGEGEDLLHGGADTDVATFTGSISRYEIVRDHGKTIVRALDRADDVDTVINVETLRFDDADYTVENAPQYTVIASLYGEVLDRQADLTGFQYWAERYAAGESMGDIALSFLYSAEYQSGSGLQFSALSTAAQLDLFYLHFLGRTPDEAGHAYWMNRIEDGMSLNDVAHSFVVSTEMQGVYAQPTAWEFLL
ncbi:cadherin domain-containing protein [Stutzerimonas kunmingensis]|uniref:cadherin domain-containing protein n=1 Tax=Stutzerimonas kunmingensis TaxID=1211807 RepID=UPI0024204A4C|nr:cadherin domain-containing protein [Stutzerimonas kunmingensis]